ncbi:MAG: S1C family serine protease [Acidobacteriaceae bacterium]
MSSDVNLFSAFSDQMVQAVEKAGESTVLVNGRRRLPASGIVYTPELILTADHVVERDEDLNVLIASGDVIPATIAGRDPGNDLALLRLEKSSAKPAEKASREARVGEAVLALGRPSQEGIEASFGIVCAIGGPVRTGGGGMLEHYLRTDVIPFPGFSGGPLIDTEGRILGLNTSGLAHGASITIPASIAWLDAENLAKFGYVKRGYLGIRSQVVAVSPDQRKALKRDQEQGLLLVSVESGSAAEAGGLIVGDILVAIEGQPVTNHDELMVYLTGQAVGNAITIQVLRGGQPISVSVTVGERK